MDVCVVCDCITYERTASANKKILTNAGEIAFELSSNPETSDFDHAPLQFVNECGKHGLRELHSKMHVKRMFSCILYVVHQSLHTVLPHVMAMKGPNFL